MIYCPSCGGSVRFDIESQMLVCDHCDNSYEPEAISDDVKNDAKGTEFFEAYVFLCPSCGGELMTNDKNDAIGFCPFCGNASMLFDRVREQWRPDYVTPFSVTKEDCKKAYLAEVKKHPFVSRKYRQPELIETFKVIYMPFWHYEGEQRGFFTIKGIEKVSEYEDETKIQYYDQHYRIDYLLSGYAHDASVEFDDHISEKLAPYYSVETVKEKTAA